MRVSVMEWMGRIGLILGSLAVCCLFMEFVVFRTILVPDDVLENVTINKVLRYKPNKRAVFRHPDGSVTQVTVNAQGWNSTKKSYATHKPHGVTRIAVVGDSYVHGAFVNPHQNFAELLERNLRAKGVNVEVLRFGMDGAPLSQYLHMLRHEVLNYHPDIVIVPLIHNDFDESYRQLRVRYASSFMKVTDRVDGAVTEVMPADFKPGLADKLRNFASFRYMYYETGLYLHAKQWVSKYFWGGSEVWQPEFIQSAVDIRKIKDHKRNRHFADYIFGEMKRLSDQRKFKLLFAMDGVREAVYSNKPRDSYEVWKLNDIARELTGKHGLTFVDLHDWFAAEYARSGIRFEFPFDWHWNKVGNRVVARALEREVILHGWVIPGAPTVAGTDLASR